MKANTHPTYYPKATITCSCGKVYEVGSTKEKTEIEICAHCHPFFTGQEKLIDTAGRIEKFKEREQKAKAVREAAAKAKKTTPKAKAAKKPVAKAKATTKKAPAKKASKTKA